MGPVRALLLLLRDVFRDRASLAAENLALRQQLAVLHQSAKRPRLRPRDLSLPNIPYPLSTHDLQLYPPWTVWYTHSSRMTQEGQVNECVTRGFHLLPGLHGRPDGPRLSPV